MSNPEQTLQRFRDVVVDNNSRTVLELSLALRKLEERAQREHFGGTYREGFVYLYRNDALNPNVVMESVVAVQGDAITSLYRNHPIFTNLNSLIDGRRELMQAVAAKIGLSIESIGIDDSTRGRTLGLSELSTGQLIDILAERIGTTVMVSGSHGGDASILKAGA